MKQVISTENKPIKLWLNDIEKGSLEQAKNLANLPFIFKHIAIMPDCHQGYGMPIGAIMATFDVVIPNAIGVDIGCGCSVIKTSIKFEDMDINLIKKIMKEIRSRIPLGFNHQKEKQDQNLLPPLDMTMPVVESQFESARKQIGTLGGGNHFIEIQKGSDGFIWIMVHSGSRNIGNKVAKHYNDLAKYHNKKWYSNVLKNLDLAFLPLNSEFSQLYLREMRYCIDFAFLNRKLIMKRICESIDEIIENVNYDKTIDLSHNFARYENHFGTNVLIHRKGATSSYKNELGIIPGSQGTSSYIVKGKGNPESFMSCSHGAGRNMSRTKARQELDLENEKHKLNAIGVIHSLRNKKDLDEASGAYKDIEIVMENQKDLVDIEVELKPLAVIKG